MTSHVQISHETYRMLNWEKILRRMLSQFEFDGIRHILKKKKKMGTGQQKDEEVIGVNFSDPDKSSVNVLLHVSYVCMHACEMFEVFI